MYFIRRSAFKALSKPVIPLIAKPRSISTVSPAVSRIQPRWTQSILQKRFYSDETSQPAQSPAVTEEVANNIPSAQEVSEIQTDSPLQPLRNQIEDDAVNRVYAGNLFFEVNEDALRNIASKFGPITECKVVYDNRGLSRGFGFITFQNREDAEAAIASLHQQIFAGRRLVMQFHVPRQSVVSSQLAKPNSPNPPSKTLFIGNMSFEMSDKDLNELFREVQGVLDVRVAMDRKTGQPRGFAHADFINTEMAEQARGLLQGKRLYGRPLRVDFGTEVRGRRDRRREETRGRDDGQSPEA